MLEFIDNKEQVMVESLYSEILESNFIVDVNKQYQESVRNYFDKKVIII